MRLPHVHQWSTVGCRVMHSEHFKSMKLHFHVCLFFLLSFNWNLRRSFTLISGIFLSTPDTPSCSHPTSLPLLLPKLPLFAFDSATSHSGFAFFVNSPYSSPPSTLLFFSVYLSCIFNAFETFKSLLFQLDFKIKQLSSVCVGWEGMMRREGLQCMRWQVQDQAFILDVWVVFERVRGKKTRSRRFIWTFSRSSSTWTS